MARPNMGDIDDRRYKLWQDAASLVEGQSWKHWAARGLDRLAQNDTRRARTLKIEQRAEADRIEAKARSIAADTGKP